MRKNSKKTKAIGIILTYNCAPLVEELFQRIPKGVLDQIIIVDDGSTDDIAKIAKKLTLPFYTHPHSGYGGNIKFGLKKALELGADVMVEIHGDGQYDPSVIPAALNKMRTGYDFLLGSRFTNLKQAIVDDHMPLERYLANIGLSILARIILQINLTEVHSGFRVYSRHLLETIGFKNTSNHHIYSFENIAQAKFCRLRITEIPIHCDYAKTHTSISIKKSIIYSFAMLHVMGEFALAKRGFKRKLFDYPGERNRNNKLSSPIPKP